MMFSPAVQRYFRHARGFDNLVNPTHSSTIGNPMNGHWFSLGVELNSVGTILEVSFTCPRCIPAIACGGYLYETMRGKNIQIELRVEDVMSALGGLPPQRAFYAWMAAESLRQIQLQVLGKASRS